MPKITQEHGSTSGGSLRTVSLVGLAVAAVGILAGAFVAGPILVPAGILAIVFFGILLVARARRAEGSLVVSRSSDSMPKGTGRTSSIIGLAIAAALGVTGVVMGSALVSTLTQRGLVADATGTVGYTTDAEIVLGLVAFVLFLVAIVATPIMIVRLVRSSRN